MLQSKEINLYMDKLGAEAKQASKVLSQASEEMKNEALNTHFFRNRVEEEVKFLKKIKKI